MQIKVDMNYIFCVHTILKNIDRNDLDLPPITYSCFAPKIIFLIPDTFYHNITFQVL